ncbi:Cloroperoxidase [Athelia psychrophila]|uniref:Cloroperoxidase n=1 Tax=Athelia psychrophila TaxID=1759441 RepID=A0A166E4L7_9AGAM|nr:Cloroperoxidase [Fibularhizoctonia sp. CBS 109695]
MIYFTALSLSLTVLPTATAFPSAAFNTPEILEGLTKRYTPSSLNTRDIPLGDLVNGILNGSLPGVNFPAINLPLSLGNISLEIPEIATIGRKAIPDDDHPFQEPASNAQRGGCPGLNIMANYGYIDRSGVTTATELLWAQQEMLGLAPDLAAALVGLTAISALDPTSLKLSIGNADTRTNGPLSLVLGQIPGIFDKAIHNTYEVDGSVAYTDSQFTSDGNTNHFNSSKWAESVAIAKAQGNQFGQAWLGAARYQHYLGCVATNPTCFWGEKQYAPSLVHSSSTSPPPSPRRSWPPPTPTASPTTPDIAAISTFWGVHANGDGTFAHVAEKLPPSADGHWYRRSVPLTFAQLALLGVEGYLQHPVVFGSNSGKPNSFTGSPGQLGNVTASPHPLCLWGRATPHKFRE